MCFRCVQAIDSKNWSCFRLMERLFDTVLNGSLSFDGIATAAFPPLIVAGGLTLLAFILATLAAFQKRPSQQLAKALPKLGTLWILGIAAIVRFVHRAALNSASRGNARLPRRRLRLLAGSRHNHQIISTALHLSLAGRGQLQKRLSKE